jgi:hypothetical protein
MIFFAARLFFTLTALTELPLSLSSLVFLPRLS